MKGLGPTVSFVREILEEEEIFSKKKFTMMVPEVQERLKAIGVGSGRLLLLSAEKWCLFPYCTR